MAVPLNLGASVEPGSPLALFVTHTPANRLTGDRNHYVAAPDGQRFLVNNLQDEGNTQPITFVMNWSSGLKR